MAEKRDLSRQKKRIKIRFGTDSPKRVAFSEDVTDCGLFVITGQPERPGQRLVLQLTLPNEAEVIARGRVQWAKKVPANLLHVAKKGGMGVCLLKFEAGEEAYHEFVASLRH